MLIKKLNLLMLGCAVCVFANAQFSISSPAFPQGGNIPARYTAFNGLNINPQLSWSNKPAGTQSFLLVMFDRTFCSGRPDTVCRSHWIVKDIPATVAGIPEGTSSTGPLPAGAELGKSDQAIHGAREYVGPFPDSTTVHLYEFKLYALNTATLSCVTPYYNYCLQQAIAGHVLGTASLFGYYLPKPLAPVPVNFVTVEATCDNGKIKCKWTTATESADAENFTVQRSQDGTNFIAVGTIPCTGNSSTIHEYNFTDSNNRGGSSYYRIRQTDRNGRFTNSYMVFVKCSSTAPWITVLPNPSTDKFTIKFNNTEQKSIQIVVYDAAGKLIYSYQSEQPAGNISILANRPPGTYLLKAIRGNEVVTERLIKTK
ncbi:MAG: YbhB/YbcL family Raf kinase inhibitor-like protein [Chitinophagaceae bacterium]|nr:YbhB/YbcL family Raf kinase inhibitor-like protein [Chitinophagaceae bacterium]